MKKDLFKIFNPEAELTILDIGGCEGEEAIRYSRIFPNATIFSFEPLPKNQEFINENINKYTATNVKLIPFAISDEAGISQFYVSSGHPENQSTDLDWDFGNKSSSLLPPDSRNNHEWLKFNEKIDVPTITLHSFLIDNEIEEVDFIHMDVQGAELKVLFGAKNLINKIKAVWLEVSDLEIYKNQPLRSDVEGFMKSNGFYLVKSEMLGNFGDQLYLNKRYFNNFSLFFMSAQFLFKKNLIKLKHIAK
ncbi:MAG: FkbM family methyltransferase [Arcicella sp.]|nr:FkbM family methyltransferase [Arcicella sp.]